MVGSHKLPRIGERDKDPSSARSLLAFVLRSTRSGGFLDRSSGNPVVSFAGANRNQEAKPVSQLKLPDAWWLDIACAPLDAAGRQLPTGSSRRMGAAMKLTLQHDKTILHC